MVSSTAISMVMSSWGRFYVVKEGRAGRKRKNEERTKVNETEEGIETRLNRTERE